MLKAAVEVSRGNVAIACAIVGKVLQDAPPGQTGWMIPIDPGFAVLREKPSLQPALALLSARAG